ncbi:MAG TPA: ankyrin repeat domain-containing protein, partial [Candidatus Krumholzibacterium sp.]|nr:ankyrin repeat domain-containing protein [Candidatus Krumholzibacterium sp.]
MKKTRALSMLSATLLLLAVTVPPAAAQSDHRIFISIRNGDIAAVKDMVGEDPGLVSVTDRNGMTPLLAASYYGKAEVVEYLIGEGSDLDYQRFNGDTAVQFASWFDFLDVVRLLHEAGADIGLKNSNGRRPLDSAIAYGSAAVASYLIEAGQSVPASSRLLHNAAAHGMKEIVDRMIEAGAGIDAPDGSGGTILHSASAGGLTGLSELAIEAGMDVNATNDYGKAPIHMACIGGHAEQVRFLASRGADITVRLPDGRTPYHLADAAGHTGAAEALAALGADTRQVPGMDVPDDRYLGQEKPGLEPVLFAPGIISVEDQGHGAPAISPRGDEIYWAKNFRSVWYIEKKDGRWSFPAPAPLWERYGATNPVFSADGKRLFFHSSLEMDGGGGSKDSDIYYVERTRDGWGEPVSAGPGMNMESADMLVSLAKDGTAYFTSDYDLYASRPKNGTYPAREKLPEPVNTGEVEMSPCIARDGSFLIFESMRPGGYSDMELYVTFRARDGAWSEPVNMGYSINRGGSRFPGLSPDGKYLFFNSTRKGSSDVYWVDAKVIDGIRKARPGMIDEMMYGVLTEDGAGSAAAERIDSAIDLYDSLKERSPGYYDFSEGMLNNLGYRLLGEERFHEAIAVLQLNTEVFPGSG